MSLLNLRDINKDLFRRLIDPVPPDHPLNHTLREIELLSLGRAGGSTSTIIISNDLRGSDLYGLLLYRILIAGTRKCQVVLLR
jgi:hypothetical protein